MCYKAKDVDDELILRIKPLGGVSTCNVLGKVRCPSYCQVL